MVFVVVVVRAGLVGEKTEVVVFEIYFLSFPSLLPLLCYYAFLVLDFLGVSKSSKIGVVHIQINRLGCTPQLGSRIDAVSQEERQFGMRQNTICSRVVAFDETRNRSRPLFIYPTMPGVRTGANKLVSWTCKLGAFQKCEAIEMPSVRCQLRQWLVFGTFIYVLEARSERWSLGEAGKSVYVIRLVRNYNLSFILGQIDAADCRLLTSQRSWSISLHNLTPRIT
mmetsp:Transcript_35762/g.85281  ORF Transcript_35762/g.85281 Transcript_35762/m.85281 type:complete len:224 (-) Transcript_35762:2214-2885(-)